MRQAGNIDRLGAVRKVPDETATGTLLQDRPADRLQGTGSTCFQVRRIRCETEIGNIQTPDAPWLSHTNRKKK